MLGSFGVGAVRRCGPGPRPLHVISPAPQVDGLSSPATLQRDG